MATGKTGGGSRYDQTPPGNVLLAKEAAAQKREEAGKNPSTKVTALPGLILNDLLPKPITANVAGTKQRVQGGPAIGSLGAAAGAISLLPQRPVYANVLGTRQRVVAEPVFADNPGKRPSKLGVGSYVRPADRKNLGKIVAVRGDVADVHFFNRAEGTHATVSFPLHQLDPVKVEFKTRGKDGAKLVPAGQSTVETGGAPGQLVREGLRGAKKARIEQEAGYSLERGQRIAAAESSAQAAGGGVGGYHAALAELKGPLAKVEFNGLKNLDQTSLDSLFTHIQQHPTLRPYEKIRTQTALMNALNGRVPTRSELALMQKVFGREVSGRIAASVPGWAKVKNAALEALNIPRAVMASMDLSAPFRQGLVAMGAKPSVFFSNFAPMVKAFGSEKVYRSLIEDIHARPTFPKMQEAGIAFTELGSLEAREEQFMSNWAEKIPFVHWSGRAYTGFLDKTRADLFDYYLNAAKDAGRDINDPNVTKSIARFVNSATGRGDLGALQSHAVTLNTLFFSPRLLASRINFLNPVYYAKLDPFARKQALLAAFRLAGVLGTTLTLAKLAGAKVNTDPRNADFAKIRVGDTRVDALGGFQQPIRLIAQLSSGKIVSSTTGKTLTLGPQGPGNLSRKDIAQRFLEQKLAPIPSLVNDLFKGTDFADKPFSWKRAAYQRMVPLLIQDTIELHQQYGNVPLDVGAYGLGAFGFGIQTYSQKQPKSRTRSGGGSVYDQSPFSGAGSVYNQPAAP